MIKVLKTGLYSTIQDSGRHGYQDYGVPYSGVMDAYSGSMANVLLGNNEDAAVIEMTMTGPTLEFNCDTSICISGADISPELNEIPIKLNKPVQVKSGDIVSFGKLISGFRSYLAVLGGFKTENVMNSYSMYQGVTKQSRLSKNNELLVNAPLKDFTMKHAVIKVRDRHFTTKHIEVFKGPEFQKLSKVQQDSLFATSFTISKKNNRMAYQLEESLGNDLEPIITSSVLPGTVQLTPSGKLIILMRDCQTTGGYPRVLQLKETAINILAQKFTGGTIHFNLK
ncbi:biotin-dependent carboxyltransferase family protein [Flavivirga spongiicola]|uniref:Biotin-dependent carboxyltransferase family protein n=1 Tax=Flavivirga spongiicola TaxID=421621 RepID=A0ABU7XM48_9FLAO|nr:biotin-dependent carboxyltransferase family protein [Flavivirga sp. MEBiC05379]MDO5981489.1 biotin-dependent carboxyltransferase family protein [Flavivirga sp. MEBiC05379]